MEDKGSPEWSLNAGVAVNPTMNSDAPNASRLWLGGCAWVCGKTRNGSRLGRVASR
jgi:hypothetical protein